RNSSTVSWYGGVRWLIAALIRPSSVSPTSPSLHLHLRRSADNDLRPAAVRGDPAGHADAVVAVRAVGRHGEAVAVVAPDHDREDLVRVRAREIDERGLAAAARGERGAGHGVAHGDRRADVAPRLLRGNDA